MMTEEGDVGAAPGVTTEIVMFASSFENDELIGIVLFCQFGFMLCDWSGFRFQ